MRAQQQLGEVDQAGAVAARLVLDVGLAHGFQPGVVRFGLDVLRAAAFVLLRVDPPRDLLGRILAVVQFQRLHHAFDQPQLVVRIHHLEAFGQLRVLPVQAQQAVGQAVEGADPHAAAAVGQLRVDAVAHFAGRLVGEGHRENAVGRHAIDFMQPGDAVGEYAGLAGTGTGQHQVVAGGSGDGFALGRVQAIKQVGDIHAPILRHRRRGSCDHLGGHCRCAGCRARPIVPAAGRRWHTGDHPALCCPGPARAGQGGPAHRSAAAAARDCAARWHGFPRRWR
ncbi:hypothetical protein G6F40_013526 [Rhizopus arrhizus]|nr:hypothetical protein G6F40_013526 [Rhizopus arrhizus]